MKKCIDLKIINGSENSALYIDNRFSHSDKSDRFNSMMDMLNKELATDNLNDVFEFTITEYKTDDNWLDIRGISHTIDYPNNFKRIPKKWLNIIV